MLDRVRQRADDFDILHFHIDQFHFPLFRPIAGRTVTTLHGRQDLTDLLPLYLGFGDMPLVSISNAQRRPIPNANFAGTVHHGIPAHLHRGTLRRRAAATSPFSAASRRRNVPTAPSPLRGRRGFRSRSPPRLTAPMRSISRTRSNRCSLAAALNLSARSTTIRNRNSWATHGRCCFQSTGPSRSGSP